MLLGNASVLDRIARHADFHAFFEAAKLTPISIHAKDFARCILWALAIGELVGDGATEETLKMMNDGLTSIGGELVGFIQRDELNFSSKRTGTAQSP